MGSSPLVLVAALLAHAACDSNETGRLRAGKLGDTSRPLTRGSPVEALRAACGDGARTPAGAAVIRRHPYVQQVTTTSAMIGWVTTAPEGEPLHVTLPDGTPIASATAVVEPGELRGGDERQLWATVAGLQPDTIYCYAVGDLTARTGFRTAPLPDDADPVRVLVFGDSGEGGSDQRALRDQMFTTPADLVIHTGDVAYDDGEIGEYEDNVFGIYTELFRNVPFFPAPGNHDHRTLQGAPFRHVFALPGDELWYSFDWGRVHFAALDTEADYATQAAWLDADLARTQLPWKVVYMHRPPYSSGHHGSDTRLRALLAPILARHGVQLVLAGHDHSYERLHPQDGIAYVVTGGGGRGTYDVGTSSFTAFSEEVIHLVQLEIGPDEAVLHAIDGSGTEFDSMVIPRAPR